MNRRSFFAAVPAALVGAKAVLEAKPVDPWVLPPAPPVKPWPVTSGYIAPATVTNAGQETCLTLAAWEEFDEVAVLNGNFNGTPIRYTRS